MGRDPRIQVPGVVYHVGAKGNRGCPIFTDDYDRRIFLTLLAKQAVRHGWLVLTYVLMSNHYHLLVELRASNLSDGMCGLNGEFSRFTSSSHRLEPGHLFRNRFWSEAIEDDLRLQAAARYIVLNPVRAGICGRPEAWSWSSYRALIGATFPPPFLAESELLKHFGRTPREARREYRALVDAGVEDARVAPRHGARHRDGSHTR